MKRILLVVEDDATTAHLYALSLGRVGYEVHVARDGETALGVVAEKALDAVLLDVLMPRLNGIEVLKRIRSDQRFRDLPVLIYTNAFIPKVIEDAKAAGATDVLEKATLTPETLIRLLGTALNYHPRKSEIDPQPDCKIPSACP